MEQIRIVLADLPRMLQEIVMDVIAEQPDMIVVAAAQGADLVEEVRRGAADLAIVPLRHDAELHLTDALLYERPRLKVIGITRDGRDSYLRELFPRTLALGDLGPDELADAIRRVARQEPSGC